MGNFNILFVDCCVRGVHSRTKELCDYFLNCIREITNGIFTDRIVLSEVNISPMNVQLLEKRDRFISENCFEDKMFDMAKQFANADYIVVGAPYWDLSFPALLKVYIENVMVTNITFRYTVNGEEGMCNAKKLIYITTSGGYIGGNNWGFEYIRAAAKMLGIEDTVCISAEGLDIQENNTDEIIDRAKKYINKNIEDMFQRDREE